MSRIFVEHDDSGILKPFDLEKHDQEVREDERMDVIAEIRVALGRFSTFEYETETTYREINYFKANKVFDVLSEVADKYIKGR